MSLFFLWALLLDADVGMHRSMMQHSDHRYGLTMNPLDSQTDSLHAGDMEGVGLPPSNPSLCMQVLLPKLIV